MDQENYVQKKKQKKRMILKPWTIILNAVEMNRTKHVCMQGVWTCTKTLTGDVYIYAWWHKVPKIGFQMHVCACLPWVLQPVLAQGGVVWSWWQPGWGWYWSPTATQVPQAIAQGKKYGHHLHVICLKLLKSQDTKTGMVNVPERPTRSGCMC